MLLVLALVGFFLAPLLVKLLAPTTAIGLVVVLMLAAAVLHATAPSPSARWSSQMGGAALEILTGFTTAVGSTATALTMSTGDSLAVRAVSSGKPVRLLQAWVDAQVNVGTLRIRSSKLHDAKDGIRLGTVVSEVRPLLPYGIPQKLFQTDVLTVDLVGSSTAGDLDTAALLLQYDDLDGAAGNFIGLDELLKRGVNLFPVENTISLGTAGGWSGAEAINSEFDNFKANTDYALVGYLTDTECAALAWRGANTGNLRIGGPGNELEKELTRSWFMDLTRLYSMPLIPVLNANNKAAFMVDGAQDENGADPRVHSIFVELAPK